MTAVIEAETPVPPPGPPPSPPELTVTRRLYTHDEFDRAYPRPDRPPPTCAGRLQSVCSCSAASIKNAFYARLPVAKAIRTYKWREMLMGDVMSGLTVSFMHLPQCMGYALLASLRPENGLYTTFFTVLTFVILGTCAQNSFGTNAVMALLTKAVAERRVQKYIAGYHQVAGNLTLGNSTTPFGPSYEELLGVRIQASATCSLLMGLILTGMGLLRFGFICTYMSDSFIGGFTTAAAIHIATSQIPKMFGIKVTSYSGVGNLVRTYIDLFRKMREKTVPAEVIIAAICIVILLLVKTCINERFRSKMKMPIPIDLVVVVVGTIISHFAKFKSNFRVTVVGPIPSNFAKPFLPSLENVGDDIGDIIVLAILCLAFSIVMSKLMAKHHGVPIDDNQEMIAYGMANVVASFFSCFPACTAPPRTMILSSLGAKTTLNGVVTSLFMLLVIMVLGQLFVSLPLSVLAAMICVSMKDLLMQYRGLPALWKVNKYDFVIWIVTNVIGVLIDLNYGLFAGIGVSVLLVVVQSQNTRGHLMTRGEAEGVFVDVTRASGSSLPRGVRIFKFTSSLYFATAEQFKSEIYKNIFDPIEFRKREKKRQLRENMLQSKLALQNGEEKGHTNGISNNENCGSPAGPTFIQCEDVEKVRDIIIDFAGIPYMDVSGKGCLATVCRDFAEAGGARVLLAGIQKQVRKLLDTAGFFDVFSRELVFLDVPDAVLFIEKERSTMVQSEYL